MTMRRIAFASALSVALAGCAARQEPPSPVQQPVQTQPQANEPRVLMGKTSGELISFFGQPALQVREGTSLKLQFRGRACVLDAYLYPSGPQLRVTHVDTRTIAGTDTDQAACILALAN